MAVHKGQSLLKISMLILGLERTLAGYGTGGLGVKLRGRFVKGHRLGEGANSLLHYDDDFAQKDSIYFTHSNEITLKWEWDLIGRLGHKSMMARRHSV